MMPLDLTWEQIALRITLACIASLAIGYNRDEYGRPAGMRTVMLVTLTATLAMLQVNLLLPQTGKTSSSFNVLDLMRLPLGILSGIGFIGAGAIIKKENGARGVTTAATLWFATMLGLLFGGGQIRLASIATVLALLILAGLKQVEARLPRMNRGTLSLDLGESAPAENALRSQIQSCACEIKAWTVQYRTPTQVALVRCEVEWKASAQKASEEPVGLSRIRTIPGVISFRWEQ